MEYKILEANGVENENIDGAAFNNFTAGGRNGIVKGVLNECSVYTPSNNSIGVGTGEILIQGFRVKITDSYLQTFTSTSAVFTRYQLVGRIVLGSDRSVTFEILCRQDQALVKDDLYAVERGTHEAEIARFTHTANGIEDVVRTMDIITGGTGSSSAGINIGQVTTNTLEAGMEAEVDIENVERNGRLETDFHISIPQGIPGSAVPLGNTENTAYEGSKGVLNEKRIQENRRFIEMLVSSGIVNEQFYQATVEDAFITRQTAGGLTVVDPSPAIVQIIKGKTVKSANLARNEYSDVTDGENGILFKRMKGVSYFQVYGTPTAAGGRTVFKVTIAKAGRYTLSVPNLPILRLELLQNDVSFLTISKGTQKHISFNIAEDNTTFTVSAVANTDDTLGTESNPTTIELMLTESDVGYVDYVPYFSGLKHANFKAIKSTGKNLLDLTKASIKSTTNLSVFQNGNELTFSGSLTRWQLIADYLELNLEDGKTYTMSCNKYYAYGKLGVRMQLAVRNKTDNKQVKTEEGYSNAYKFTVDNSQYRYFVRIQAGDNAGGEFNETLRWMLNYGDTEQPFEPYTEEEYTDGNAYELPEYDYIYPQKGEIERQTGYATSQTVFTEEELANYNEPIVSADGLSLAYKLATPTVEKIDYPKEYSSYNKGRETVEQGEVDNSQWGAIVTTEIQYYVLGGITSES